MYSLVSDPLVSVIVPVLNGDRFLDQALQSIFNQSYRNFEIILVDGNSTDDTKAIAISYPEINYICQTNQGIANAHNIGIEAAKGEFIAFLSHDDLWTTDKLTTQINNLLEHAHLQYTIARVKFFLEAGHSIPKGFRPNLLEGDHIAYGLESLVVRKDLFQIVGNFSSEFSIAIDVDWYARAKDSQVEMSIINKVLLHKRIHNSNTSLNIEVNNQNLLKLLSHSIKRKRDIKLNEFLS